MVVLLFLQVDITNWVSSKHNMGMSFNKEVWVKIKSCAQAFCAFDDYNWDWSLHNIGMTCIPNKLKVMVSKSPRIYHIGEWSEILFTRTRLHFRFSF